MPEYQKRSLTSLVRTMKLNYNCFQNSRKEKQYYCMQKEENNQNPEVSELFDSFWLKQIRMRNNYNIKAILKHQVLTQ